MSARPARPLVIAHRGASAYRPENTLPAYDLAVEQRADMIEIDLHLTRDDQIVISHDAELGHFGTEGYIGDLELEEVRTLDAGRGSGGIEQVPTLEEVLDEFANRIPFNLEIKWGPAGDYVGLEERALAALATRGLTGATLFSSFRDSVLSELRRLSPEARLGVLVSPREPERILARAEVVGAEAINPHFLCVNEDLVRAAHASDLAVYVYTVDEPEAMERLLDMGVDGLFTNVPDVMRRLIDV